MGVYQIAKLNVGPARACTCTCPTVRARRLSKHHVTLSQTLGRTPMFGFNSLSHGKRWLPHCQRVLFRSLSLRTTKPLNFPRQVVPIFPSSPRLPQPTWVPPTLLHVETRCLHGAAGRQKDVDLNTNPFYDKYKEKLDGIQGYLTLDCTF